MSAPLREEVPRTIEEAMADFKASLDDLSELIHLPHLPKEAERLAAQAGLRMTGAALCLGMLAAGAAPPAPLPLTLEPGVEVVGLRWYSCPSGHCIGFVGLIDRTAATPYFKVYIGLAGGLNRDSDTRAIARRGHPLLDEEMARHLVGKHHAFAGLRYEY